MVVLLEKMSSRHIFSLLMTLVFFIYLGPNQLVNSPFNKNRVLIVLQLLCWLAQDYSRAFSINKKSTRREQADYRSYKMRGSESPQTKHVIDIPENSEKIVTIIQSSTILKSSFQEQSIKRSVKSILSLCLFYVLIKALHLTLDWFMGIIALTQERLLQYAGVQRTP